MTEDHPGETWPGLSHSAENSQKERKTYLGHTAGEGPGNWGERSKASVLSPPHLSSKVLEQSNYSGKDLSTWAAWTIALTAL